MRRHLITLPPYFWAKVSVKENFYTFLMSGLENRLNFLILNLGAVGPVCSFRSLNSLSGRRLGPLGKETFEGAWVVVVSLVSCKD